MLAAVVGAIGLARRIAPVAAIDQNEQKPSAISAAAMADRARQELRSV
jgi:hypothetical protein